MSRKGQSITLSVSEQDKSQLEALATSLGITRGERGNVSGLLEAIARQRVLVMPNLSLRQIEALRQASRALIDAGFATDATLIAQFLIEHGNLEAPIRADIERFLATPPVIWRRELDSFIYRQQPFQLSYQDAASRVWTFTIRHAQIVEHERRQYLDCWCDQVEGNQDLLELSHNWCLRLDRIPEAAISPIDGKWRDNLDRIDVEFHLFGGLAFAYQPRPLDSLDEKLPHDRQVRRIIRRISSTFWFLREILRYGEECEIIAPSSVRELMKQKSKALCDRYHLEVRD